MLKILLYCSAEERRVLENALQKPLKKYNISFNIRYLSNSRQLMKNYLLNSRVIELKSGAKVIMTKGYFDKFKEAYSKSVSRLANLKTFDD